MWSFTKSNAISPCWHLSVGGEVVTFTPGPGRASARSPPTPGRGSSWTTPEKVPVALGEGRHWSQ